MVFLTLSHNYKGGSDTNIRTPAAGEGATPPLPLHPTPPLTPPTTHFGDITGTHSSLTLFCTKTTQCGSFLTDISTSNMATKRLLSVVMVRGEGMGARFTSPFHRRNRISAQKSTSCHTQEYALIQYSIHTQTYAAHKLFNTGRVQ